MTTFVLLNPAGGEGAAGRRWQRLQSRVAETFGKFELIESRMAGDLARATIAIAKEPIPSLILAAGGDGTSHEIINGLHQAGTPDHVRLGWLPIGSGNDLARGSGTTVDPVRYLTGYRHPVESSQDLGVVRFGDGTIRAFGNSFTLGTSVEVLRRCARSRRPLGGRLDYGLAAAAAIVSDRPGSIHMTVDGRSMLLRECRLLAVTNGPTIGAGMRIAPGACLDDGAFDLLWLEPLGRMATLALFPRIYWGGHLTHRAVRRSECRTLVIDGDGPCAVEMDGELVDGRRPMEVVVRPSAIAVVRPGPS